MQTTLKGPKIHSLYHLEEIMRSRLTVHDDKISIVKLSYHGFVQEVINVFQEYAKSKKDIDLCLFIVQNHIQKYNSAIECYRHLYGLIQTWKKSIEHYEQSKLLLSLLSIERSSKESIKLFLKVRKSILHKHPKVIMQEIILSHYMIAIAHTFSQEMKDFSMIKIKDLFVSLRKKSIHANKINGAVACEFFLNSAQIFKKTQLQNIKEYYESKQYHQKAEFRTDFTPVKPVEMFEEQYRVEPDSEIQSLIYQEQCIKNANRPISNLKISHRKGQERSFIKEQSKSKSKSKSKTKSRSRSNLKQTPSQTRLENAKSIIDRKYSNSWQKFIYMNQVMKQRLLKSPQYY